MFDFIRTHQRLMQLVLLLLILPSFAFFGVQSYSRFRQGQEGIATVAGQPITQQDFDAAQRTQIQRLQRMFGQNIDPKMFDTPQARAQIIDSLVTQRVLQSQIIKSHMAVSNERVAEVLSENPAIKALYGADGKLDAARYDQLLASVGLTRDQVFNDTRNEILFKEIAGTIADSSFMPKATVNRLGALLGQQRDVQALLIKSADFLKQVKLADDAVQKYYDANTKEFEIPEQVKIAYVTLDQAALASRIQVNPADVKTYYEQNQKRYAAPEERRASHILITAAKDASDADKAKAKAKADELLAKVRAHPGDFAKLAKEFSNDPGSAEKGGDLDWAPVSNYVPPFAEALSKLKVNEISDVVQTDFGYHIIELTGIRPATVKSLDEVKPEIEKELRNQLASKQFAEAAESFSNLVYDQPDSLTPAAEKFGLSIQQADGLTRNVQPSAKPNAVLDNGKLRAAVFADDVLKNKHNTQAIEIAPNTLAAAHVIDYKPAAVRPLSEVADAIKSQLTQNEARKLAMQSGESMLAKLKGGGDEAGFGAPMTVGRASHGDLSADTLKQIFQTDANTLPAYAGLSVASGDFAIYRIVKVVNGTGSSTAANDPTQKLARDFGELEFAGYLESLKHEFKVQISKQYASVGGKRDETENP